MSDQNKEMIRAEGLSKYYGAFAAIDNVSFTVPRGQVAALNAVPSDRSHEVR